MTISVIIETAVSGTGRTGRPVKRDDIRLCPDDIAHGWTIGMLRAAQSLYVRGDRAPITVDGHRRYNRAHTRAVRAAAIYRPLKRNPVILDDVEHLLRMGETIETVAARLGITEHGIVNAATDRGTASQRAAVARATQEMRAIREGMSPQKHVA